MYVADITDMAEINELIDETSALLADSPWSEQLQWDLEDLLSRKAELIG